MRVAEIDGPLDIRAEFLASITLIDPNRAVEDVTPVVYCAVVILFIALEAWRSDTGGQCRFILISALSAQCGGRRLHSAFAQSNEYDWVNVCNRGDVDLNYVVLRTRWNPGQRDHAQHLGWQTIRKGKCENVNSSVYQAVTTGVAHALWEGGLGNPVYVPEGAEPANGNKRAPRLFARRNSCAMSPESFENAGYFPPDRREGNRPFLATPSHRKRLAAG